MEQSILPEIEPGLCNGCGKCVAACTHQALALQSGKAVLARSQACSWDGDCELVCPHGAIRVYYAIIFADDGREYEST